MKRDAFISLLEYIAYKVKPFGLKLTEYFLVYQTITADLFTFTNEI